MGRWLRCLSVFLMVFQAPLLCANDWTAIATKLNDAIVAVESKGGSCTGGIIDATRGHILTAEHCFGEELFADSLPATVVMRDRKRDLMVLKVPAPILDRPALTVAAHDPGVGSEVGSYGFGYALDRPLFRHAWVSDDQIYIPEIGGPYIAIDTPFLPGQSGGPVINEAGQIVMIVQRANDRMGIGVGAATIAKKAGKFFTQPAK